ncbi:histone deacetylase family protein, partial [Mycobacterium tuberculosis]|nr:histone deacetylase family protein [Mycobacterium tuberculosis]
DRIRAIDRILEHERFQPLAREEAVMGEAAQILLAHPEAHLDRVRAAAPDIGQVGLDEDTSMSPGSWEAALRAVGGVCQAVDEVFEK